MKATVLVSTVPRKVNDVAKSVTKLDVKEVLIVTGRADIVVFLESSREKINNKIKRLLKIENVETTETLWEVES